MIKFANYPSSSYVHSELNMQYPVHAQIMTTNSACVVNLRPPSYIISVFRYYYTVLFFFTDFLLLNLMDNSFKEQYIIIEEVKHAKELDNIRTSDTNQHLKMADDADYADSKPIADHEFVPRKSVPKEFPRFLWHCHLIELLLLMNRLAHRRYGVI